MKNIRNREPITDKHVLDLITECKNVCAELNYSLPRNLRFLQCKAFRRAGLACHADKTIVLSSFIFKESDDAVKSTILHEMGHIIAGPGVKHGPGWQKIVNRMNAVTGLHITRCYNEEDLPIHASAVAQSYKYIFTCRGCGIQLKYTKRSRFVQTYDEILCSGKPRWTCSRCGGTFQKAN